MTKVDATTWRVTTKLASSGGAGSLDLKVTGTDPKHGTNVATVTVGLK